MNKTCTWMGLALLFWSAAIFAQAPQAAERQDDHTALRAMMAKATEALNTRKLDLIAPSLHPAFTVITVDNQKLVGLAAFRKYWDGLFDGPDALLVRIEAKPDADDLTHFLDDDTGVVYGTSQDTYHFKDGDVRTMRTRWSAVVEKESDGWRLVNVHFSANLLDNPMLDAAKSYALKFAAAAGIAGLVLGALLLALLRRR